MALFIINHKALPVFLTFVDRVNTVARMVCGTDVYRCLHQLCRYLGHPTSSSPNIDQLARDSVQLDQFYTSRFEGEYDSFRNS